MKRRHLFLCLISMLGLGLNGIHAQQAILASGGDASGGGGSVCYSLGQVVYSTKIGIDGYSSAEGVQQPFEIQIITGIEQHPGINLEYTVYPNPIAHTLNLKVENYDYELLSFQLYDLKGKLLENRKITNEVSNIEMGKYPPASYVLKIIANDKDVKTFKVIKY